MKANTNLIEWLHSEFNRRNLTYAELGRMTAPSWQAWQQLLTHLTSKLSPEMEEAICEAFNISMIQLVNVIETGQPDGNELLAVNEHPGPQYGRDQSRPLSPELQSLFQWLEHEACADQLTAVLAHARMMGFDSPAKHSSPFGREESPSDAKVA